jgi:Flp pilus assembly pilin Flp
MKCTARRMSHPARLLRDRSGSVAIEYALIATLIAAALIATLGAVSAGIIRLLGIAGTGLDFTG